MRLFFSKVMNRLRAIKPEEFNNICSGVQSIVVSLAVLLGGLWTYFTFRTLGQTTKARAEISVMEKQLKEQAAFDLELDAVQELVPEGEGQYISVAVHIKNTGNRSARIDFNETSLSVSRVHFDTERKMVKESGSSVPVPYDGSGVVVRANTRETIPFFVKVPGPGLYLLHFQSAVSPEEKQVAAETGIPASASISWSRDRFFVVKSVAPAK